MTFERIRPRLADIRAASKDALGLGPLDLANDPLRAELDVEGQWLWDTLGAVLLERGYLTCCDSIPLQCTCLMYSRRHNGAEFASGLEFWLDQWAVTSHLLRQLEATKTL